MTLLRDRHRRSPGAARAGAPSSARPSSRLREIQQLIDDLIETMRAADGAGLAANQVSVPMRIAVVEVDEQPPLPVQAARPADRDRQPRDRGPLDDEAGRSTRDACRCPTCGATSSAHVDVRVHYLDRDGQRHERRRARPHRRHVPARGRPPRRRAVPRPRHRPAQLQHVGAVRAPSRGGVPASGSRRTQPAPSRPGEPLLVRAGLARWRGRSSRRADRGGR